MIQPQQKTDLSFSPAYSKDSVALKCLLTPQVGICSQLIHSCMSVFTESRRLSLTVPLGDLGCIYLTCQNSESPFFLKEYVFIPEASGRVPSVPPPVSY